MFKFVFLSSLIWARVLVFIMFFSSFFFFFFIIFNLFKINKLIFLNLDANVAIF